MCVSVTKVDQGHLKLLQRKFSKCNISDTITEWPITATNVPTMRQRCHGFEGGGQFFLTPPFVYMGEHETEYCTVFIIVIMSSKRLPAANEIT